MKYELTTETKIHFGTTLYRIKALTTFGNVEKGELGGFIEKESNLDQYGNAWVSGDAKVYGNARVSGDAEVFGDAEVSGDARVFGNAEVYGEAEVKKTPINIIGLYWQVTITEAWTSIGCQGHANDVWLKMRKGQFSKMDKHAEEFYAEHGAMIRKLIRSHGGTK
jgi:hypothetical protein